MPTVPGGFRLMGIVNVTPDSFSDGGRFLQARAAIEHGLALIGEGAQIVDVGGESTRPGAEPVSVEEELRRVQPVVEGLASAATGAQISIDTSKARVARAALDAGATLVNDVTALRGDREMAETVAESGAECCLMHMLGDPQTMQQRPALRGRRRRGQGVSAWSAWSWPCARASRRSACCWTRGSASARRSITTCSCSRAWTSSSRWAARS